ncbi:pyridoxal-phosphate dependent enzyme [Sphingosinicella rhizophila]|uniref:L-serine ammonia-lyase n=1 Tax=Sphingosinicella rhizophila TaxID=3050082 RepID=A0ABU3QBC4_9SPHN|nr:pyridoxal-phosphate dependent enzyme [Sphingosinicella sp. GR2756]MDT9600689.1 pyridoxal-phosphate dependent enzyme [Sphingosinicella sp. GR2756]
MMMHDGSGNGLYIQTPIAESQPLNARAGRRVLFKMECHQPSGSFKMRGVSHLMSTHKEAGVTQFISSSGGNAGLAVAHCAARLGVSATVFVPDTTSLHVRGLLAGLGADVRVAGSVWNEADAAARALRASSDAIYVSPFDDPLLWEGHSTMIDEAAVQMDRPDAVIVSVGGGGMMCGVLQGMHRNGWADVPVVAVETDGAASFAAAVAAGRPVSIGAITSIAKTLGSLQVADAAFEWTKRHDIRSAVLSDRQAIQGCLAFADDLHVLVEPACGVSVALAEQGHPALGDAGTVLVIACGGSAVSARQTGEWALAEATA